MPTLPKAPPKPDKRSAGQRKTPSMRGARNKTSSTANKNKAARAVRTASARAADQAVKDRNFNAQVQATKKFGSYATLRTPGSGNTPAKGPVNPFDGGVLSGLNPFNTGITKKKQK